MAISPACPLSRRICRVCRYVAGLLFSLLVGPSLATATVDPDSTASLIGPHLRGSDAAVAVFEPAYGATFVTARLRESSCLFVRLPGKWELAAGVDGISLREMASERQVDVALYDAAEFAGTPGSNLAASYAAHLQRDYEELLGRPVTATALESVDGAGAYRWRATWSDKNFDNAARALSLERFIVQRRPDAVIEVSFSGPKPGDRDRQDKVLRSAVATLELRDRPDCRS